MPNLSRLVALMQTCLWKNRTKRPMLCWMPAMDAYYVKAGSLKRRDASSIELEIVGGNNELFGHNDTRTNEPHVYKLGMWGSVAQIATQMEFATNG